MGYIIVYVLEVAVLYYKHFRSHPYETVKWKFEESRVHILLFPIPSTVRLITGHTATGHSNTCQELIRPITMNTMPVNRIFTIP